MSQQESTPKNLAFDPQVMPLGETLLKLLEPSNAPHSQGRIGHFEVLGLLGEGTFGLVLKARDETLGRDVALKLLKPELAASETNQIRFTREAKALAACEHHNIVTIHTVAFDAKPVPYFVMEYISGPTLEQALTERERLPIREVIRVAYEIACGLAAAHAVGLMHRDLKPGNILLRNKTEVKIADFGLARSLHDSAVTPPDRPVGTPLYMAPEQAQLPTTLGQGPDKVDHRADLFSLGTILYRMCTGNLPFHGESAAALVHQIIHHTPEPIRNPDTPSWLAYLVERLLAKEPSNRFQTAAEVAVLLLNLPSFPGNEQGQAVRPHKPAETVRGRVSADSAHALASRKEAMTVLERVIDDALKAGDELCVAGIANTDFFGAHTAPLNRRVRDGLKGGLHARFIFLDPTSAAAKRRRIFELGRLNPIDTINGSIQTASILRSESGGRLQLRLAQEVSSFLCFNTQEVVYHPYFTSVTGHHTLAWNARGYTLGQVREHFENLWGQRWVLFDLGNVLIRFDHRRVGRQLASCLPAHMRNKGLQREAYDFIFNHHDAPSRNALIDRGQKDLTWLCREFNQHFKTAIGEEQFREAWCCIFDELDIEAFACVQTVLKQGIKVGICSNTNSYHWKSLCEKYPALSDSRIEKFLSFELGKLKSDPGFFQRVTEITKRPNEEHLLIDDLDANLIAAEANSMHALKVKDVVRYEDVALFLEGHLWI